MCNVRLFRVSEVRIREELLRFRYGLAFLFRYQRATTMIMLQSWVCIFRLVCYGLVITYSMMWFNFSGLNFYTFYGFIIIGLIRCNGHFIGIILANVCTEWFPVYFCGFFLYISDFNWGSSFIIFITYITYFLMRFGDFFQICERELLHEGYI